MNRIHLLIVLLAAIAVPFAAADTIQLNQNNLGISGSVGTVTLTQGTGGVMVTYTANAGFSLKTNGGDFLFDTNVALKAGSISDLKVDGYSPNFGFTAGATRAGINYSYDITNLMKGSLPHAYVSASTVSFFVSGVTLKQLESGSFGVHFCVGGGTSAVRIRALLAAILQLFRSRVRCRSWAQVFLVLQVLCVVVLRHNLPSC